MSIDALTSNPFSAPGQIRDCGVNLICFRINTPEPASRLTYRQKRKPCIEERCIRMDIMDMLECFLIAETNLEKFFKEVS